jgi:hypothetical protein
VEASPQFGSGFQQIIGNMPRPSRDTHTFLPLDGKCSACWIAAVTSIDPLIGVDEAGRSVVLNLEQCRLVLVDGQLDGPFTGVDLVKVLKDAGKFCVGITWSADKNKELGAHVAVEKAALFAALARGDLTLAEILQGREKPEELEQKFKLFNGQFHADKDFRKLAEEIIHPKPLRP